MPVKLTLNIFSGRPNPFMILDDATARDLFKRLSFGALKKVTEKTTPFPSVLGYRGLIIEQQGKKLNADLPTVLQYTHDMLYADDKAAKAESGLESFLFENFDKLQDIKDLPDLRRTTEILLKDYLDNRKRWIDGYFKNIDLLRDDILLRPVCPCAPVADLAAWNTDYNITSKNNCYNYSTNYRSDTFGQPGQASGQKWNNLSACDVPAPGISAKMGAVADGLVDKPLQDNKCISPGHLVALVNYPNHDYHWYRKGSNGKWSHKMGGNPATVLDNSGNSITDPRTANRGAYTGFCTFMQAIHGHFKMDGIYD